MDIEITVRHVEIGQDIKDYGRAKVEKMLANFPRVESSHLILDRQKHNYFAEIVIQGKNHIRVEAEETADDFRAAIDQALTKAEKQLRRSRDKVVKNNKQKSSLADAESVIRQ